MDRVADGRRSCLCGRRGGEPGGWTAEPRGECGARDSRHCRFGTFVTAGTPFGSHSVQPAPDAKEQSRPPVVVGQQL